MSVIVTGMDMPKDCGVCMECTRLKAFCPVDGHHEPHLDKRRCPLKSIDGLIDKFSMVNGCGDFIATYDVINIIKEYCEVSE